MLSIKEVLDTACTCLGLGTTVIAALGFLPNVWLFDLASQLRIVHAAVLGCCLIVLLLVRARIATAIVLIGFILNAAPIVMLYLDKQQAPMNHREVVSILNFNTEFQHNDQVEQFEDLVSSRNPDIVALVEVNKKWSEAIKPTMQRYPYSKTFLVGPGMALFSKFPIEQIDVQQYGRSHHPRITTTISIRDRPVRLIIAHPTTPQSPNGFQERNQELSVLQAEMSALASPKILIGDLNCGPWSPAFADLLGAGLRDSQQGFGPQPSWPARTGRVLAEVPILPLVPIDHVLVSKDIVVLDRAAGPPLGSDHLPVFVKIALPNGSE